MSTAQEWNDAYIHGALRRKSDMDVVMAEPTDTSRMYPDDLPSPTVILVGGLAACAFVIIGGLMLAGWLSA